MSSLLTTQSGVSVNPVGIGTWGIGGKFEADTTHDAVGIEAIEYALELGQNHIDTAERYGAGHSEEIVGLAAKKFPRNELYIATKLWETHVDEGLVRPAVEAMLERLRTDYIDLLYIHKAWEDWPWRNAINQINDLIDTGLVRGFGASNFSLDELKETLGKSKHGIAALQMHHNILHTSELTTDMLDFCKSNNIQPVAYQPLERGEVLHNPLVMSIATKRGVEPSQVALAWLHGQGIYSIPQSLKKKNIESNFASAQLTLTDTEFAALAKI